MSPSDTGYTGKDQPRISVAMVVDTNGVAQLVRNVLALPVSSEKFPGIRIVSKCRPETRLMMTFTHSVFLGGPGNQE